MTLAKCSLPYLTCVQQCQAQKILGLQFFGAARQAYALAASQHVPNRLQTAFRVCMLTYGFGHVHSAKLARVKQCQAAVSTNSSGSAVL